MKKIKYYSYQDPRGVNYINAQIGDKSITLRKKSFTSVGLRTAAKLERGKRNLQDRVSRAFKMGEIIDPKTGAPVVQDARKRRLVAQGVKPTIPEKYASKATEIGKNGYIDPVAVGRRVIRKTPQAVGSLVNGAIDLVDTVAYPIAGAIHTPGRTLSKGIEKTIENPLAAGLTASTYVAPFTKLPLAAKAAIGTADSLIPDAVQFKIVDRFTPLPNKTKKWLKKKSEQWANSKTSQKMRGMTWADPVNYAKEKVMGAANSAKNAVQSVMSRKPQVQTVAV